MRQNWLALVSVLIVAGGTAACDNFDFDGGGDRAEAPFHYGFDVNPGAHFELETFNGSVEIRSWDQNKVDISGTKYANSAAMRDAIRIDAHGNASGVFVRATKPSGRSGNMGVKFVVQVPRDIVLDHVSSSNAPIKIQDVNSPVHARTSNGGITLSGVQGAVDAETSNGGIDVTGLVGNAVLTTDNSHIHADHLNGPVEATTSNGNIDLAFEAPPKNDIHATTSNGGIEITMPASSAARIRADTSNGSITSDFPVTNQGSESKNHLEGTVNGGGPLLALETSNGSIKVIKP